MKKQLPKIAAIIVAYNEEKLIEKIIRHLRQQEYEGETEILLADGNSTDQTACIAKFHKVKIVISPRKGKATQMNAASREVRSDVLFFVHADMQLQKNTFMSIANAINKGYSGGGFSNVFDSENSKIKRLGTLMNFRFLDTREQSDKGCFYGDNGIFVKQDVFQELKGFKEIPIMEDYEFSRRLGTGYKTIKIKDPQIIVSARRHTKSGFIRTRLSWILIRKLFRLGVSPNTLARTYKDVR